jgi:hypothetical protein
MTPVSTQSKTKNNPTRNDLEPQAGISCASACIHINYGNQSTGAKHLLKPVYTHQIFEEEVIRGYQPFESDILEAQELSSEFPSNVDRGGSCHKTTRINAQCSH